MPNKNEKTATTITGGRYPRVVNQGEGKLIRTAQLSK